MKIRDVLLKLAVFLLLSADAHFSFADGYATYNPNTGRIVVEAYDVDSWYILSESAGLTGPDDPLANGVLVSNSEVSVDFEDYKIVEYFWVYLSDRYVFHDLGRIAQTHLPPGDLVFYCDCPFNAPTGGYVIYIPEPTGVAMVAAFICGSCLRPKRRCEARG